MAKARDLMGKSGTGGFMPPSQPKKLDLTVPEEVDTKKSDSKHPKVAPPKDDKPAMGFTAPTIVWPTRSRRDSRVAVRDCAPAPRARCPVSGSASKHSSGVDRSA